MTWKSSSIIFAAQNFKAEWQIYTYPMLRPVLAEALPLGFPVFCCCDDIVVVVKSNDGGVVEGLQREIGIGAGQGESGEQ